MKDKTLKILLGIIAVNLTLGGRGNITQCNALSKRTRN